MKLTSNRLILLDLLYIIVLVLSGTLLALWPDKIESSIEIPPILIGRLPLVFAVVVALSILLFFLKEYWRITLTTELQNAAGEARNAYEESLRKQIAELKSMPPKKFLGYAKTTFRASYIAYYEAITHPSDAADKREILERGIRQLLWGALYLASEFEPDYNPQSRYAANIMLFNCVADLSTVEKEQVEKRLVFCDESTTVGGLRAVLDLQTNLSTALVDPGVPDVTLKRGFALPLPVTAHANTKTRIIPGAPEAVCRGVPQAVRDTRVMHEICRENGDFTEQVLRDIRDYFDGGHGKDIRSIITIPLYECRAEPTDPRKLQQQGEILDDSHLVGVLNIHSNQTGMISDAYEPIGEYTLTLAPFNVLMVELIMSLQQLIRNTVEQFPVQDG